VAVVVSSYYDFVWMPLQLLIVVHSE